MGIRLKAGDRVYIPALSRNVFTAEAHAGHLRAAGNVRFSAAGYIFGRFTTNDARLPEVWPATREVAAFFRSRSYTLDDNPLWPPVENPATQTGRTSAKISDVVVGPKGVELTLTLDTKRLDEAFNKGFDKARLTWEEIAGRWNPQAQEATTPQQQIDVILPNGDTLATQRQQTSSAKIGEALGVSVSSQRHGRAFSQAEVERGPKKPSELHELPDWATAPDTASHFDRLRNWFIKVDEDNGMVSIYVDEKWHPRRWLDGTHVAANPTRWVPVPIETNTQKVKRWLSQTAALQAEGIVKAGRAYVPCHATHISQARADARTKTPELVYMDGKGQLYTAGGHVTFVCPAYDLVLPEQK